MQISFSAIGCLGGQERESPGCPANRSFLALPNPFVGLLLCIKAGPQQDSPVNLAQPNAELSVTQLALAFFPRCCFGITSQSTYGPVPGNCTQGLRVTCSDVPLSRCCSHHSTRWSFIGTSQCSLEFQVASWSFKRISLFRFTASALCLLLPRWVERKVSPSTSRSTATRTFRRQRTCTLPAASPKCSRDRSLWLQGCLPLREKTSQFLGHGIEQRGSAEPRWLLPGSYLGPGAHRCKSRRRTPPWFLGAPHSPEALFKSSAASSGSR
ncbi:uncharacterized protein LOC125086677 [Lutra lutra]|uniref:uncharacterized protein LOC125086677 n=1 Tax=Lutra lutra TaxID=9657 RepID=UPI001FCFDAA7|nr:uncharacterized protein LOC125086677 [Lutra lutra]